MNTGPLLLLEKDCYRCVES